MGMGNRIIHAADGGLIAFYRLSEWWDETFTDGERELIRETCDPSGDMSLTKGRIWESSGTAVQMLNGLANYFSGASGYPVAIRLLEKAFEIGSDGAVIDQHYTCEGLVQLLAGSKGDAKAGLDVMGAACQCQIDLAPQLGQELFREGAVRLPGHLGYETLIGLRDESEHYEDGIRLCRQARHEGWSGDWDKTVKRMTRKLSRRQTPPDELQTDDPAVTRDRLSYLLHMESERFAPKVEESPPVPAETDDYDTQHDGDFYGSLPPAFIQDFAQGSLEPNLADMRALDDERDRVAERLRSEVDALHAEVRELRDDRESLQGELEDSQRRAEALAREFLQEQGSRESVARDLESATGRIAELNGMVDELETQVLETALERDEFATRIEEIEAERRKLDERLRDHESAAVGRAEDLRAARAEAEQLRGELEERVSALRAELESERAEKGRIRSELDDREASFQTTLEEKVAAQSDRARLSIALSEMETEANVRAEELETLRAELDEFHADAAQRMASLAVMKGEMDEMRRALREREKLAEEVSRLGVERESTIESLETELEEFRGKYTKSARRQEDLEAQLDEAEAKFVAVHDELDEAITRAHSVEQSIETLRSAFDMERTALQSERDGLSEDLTSAWGELESTQGALDSAQGALASTQGELESAQGALASARDELESRERELSDSGRLAEEREEDLALLRADLEAARAQQSELIGEVETLRQTAAARPALSAPVEAGSPGPAIDDAPTSLDSLRQEVQALRQHVDEAVQARDGMLMEVRRVQATALHHAQLPVQTPPPDGGTPLTVTPPSAGETTILNPEWEYDPYTRPAPQAAVHINYECPHCRRNLRIPRQFAGWFGQCKLCGHDITVPKV